jgi:TolA-binding protein
VETYFRHKREKEAIEQYIRGYQEFPEGKEESDWVESTLKLALCDVPYEPDDMGL